MWWCDTYLHLSKANFKQKKNMHIILIYNTYMIYIQDQQKELEAVKAEKTEVEKALQDNKPKPKEQEKTRKVNLKLNCIKKNNLF